MDIKVMRSNAGYYIGVEREGMPYARLSGYYRNDIEAHNAMAEGWQGGRSENLRLEAALIKTGKLLQYAGLYRAPLCDEAG